MYTIKDVYQQQAAEAVSLPTAVESGNEGSNTPSEAVEPTWRDDWRQAISGGDEAKAERISRYSSPSAVADALISAQNKISSGELRSPFPSEGSEEEQAAWRKDNNLPDNPSAYSLDFDSGLVIGDDDKEIIDTFLESAYKSNQTNEQVKHSLEWFYDQRERNIAERQEKDLQLRQESQDKLNAEWGGEYRANMNSIKSFIDTMPENIRDNFLSSRMADGTPVLSDPNLLQWMLNQAKEINPAATLVPAAGADPSGSIEDEIIKIQELMGNSNSEYWKGERAEPMQQRYRDLINARERLKTRS